MIRFLLVAILPLMSFASSNFANMKKCEKIQLSKFTALVSCHQIDYLIEYKFQDDEEKDNLKKVTAITVNDKKILINESK